MKLGPKTMHIFCFCFWRVRSWICVIEGDSSVFSMVKKGHKPSEYIFDYVLGDFDLYFLLTMPEERHT